MAGHLISAMPAFKFASLAFLAAFVTTTSRTAETIDFLAFGAHLGA
jgi:hypothetical protein